MVAPLSANVRVPETLGELSPGDASALLSMIVVAARVRRRHQFFAWTQGHLQTLLPHSLLLCATARAGGVNMFFEHFYNVPVPAAPLARLCDRRDGLGLELLDAWRSAGGDPLPIGGPACAHPALAKALADLGFGPALVHGIPSDQSNTGAHGFFGFVSMRAPMEARELAFAQMVVPHAFSAYCRVLTPEREKPAVAAGAPQESEGVLTEREVEIIRWVRDGKSNQEIGMVLDISPLTVKNHVQRILRKLGAANRAQAVAMVIASRQLSGPLRAVGERMRAEEAGAAIAD